METEHIQTLSKEGFVSHSENAQELFPVEYVRAAPGTAKHELVIGFYAVLLDALCIQFGTFLGVLGYEQLRSSSMQWPSTHILLFALEYTVLFCFFAGKRGLYKHAHSLLEIRATAETLRVSTLCFALVTVTIFFHHLIVPRIMLLLSWVLSTLILLIQQHAARETIVRWKSKRVPHRKVLIVGAGREARRIFSILSKSPDMGLHPVAFVVEEGSMPEPVIYGHDYRWRESAPVLREQLSAGLLERLAINEVFVADLTMSGQRIGELVSLGLDRNLPISFIGSKYYPGSVRPAGIRFLDDLHVVSAMPEEKRDLMYAGAKRVFDILVSAALILFTAPLWIAIAVWVRLSSPGPVFFRQIRIGKKGKPFGMLKFRSMYTTAPKYGRSPESATDPRVTSAGRFLRKTSLDELPQILNVLKGDMSLVGPRPEMPFIVAEYSDIERQRLMVDQGMTGFWQLSADRRGPIHERIEYDLYYLEQKGFFFDLAILVHTAFFAMKGV